VRGRRSIQTWERSDEPFPQRSTGISEAAECVSVFQDVKPDDPRRCARPKMPGEVALIRKAVDGIRRLRTLRPSSGQAKIERARDFLLMQS